MQERDWIGEREGERVRERGRERIISVVSNLDKGVHSGQVVVVVISETAKQHSEKKMFF